MKVVTETRVSQKFLTTIFITFLVKNKPFCMNIFCNIGFCVKEFNHDNVEKGAHVTEANTDEAHKPILPRTRAH